MTDEFNQKIVLRWVDLDPNFHLRHSAYYDFGAQRRIELLGRFGITLEVMQAENFGPILFREEAIFKREIKLTDSVLLTTRAASVSADGSRWTLIHEFLNEQTAKVLTIITVDGAWIDTKLRKLASPTPSIVIEAMNRFPKTATFKS